MGFFPFFLSQVRAFLAIFLPPFFHNCVLDEAIRRKLRGLPGSAIPCCVSVEVVQGTKTLCVLRSRRVFAELLDRPSSQVDHEERQRSREKRSERKKNRKSDYNG
ncbi:hypothetical protein B0J18DRAFT_145502 [Chaetomium sp. MPI-SDFR-AT-0129]|nr:hypothetical protein B0J18DRAFT_145502 [Chaetomium sp. MPI-SDFR-AT-0129]